MSVLSHENVSCKLRVLNQYMESKEYDGCKSHHVKFGTGYVSAEEPEI